MRPRWVARSGHALRPASLRLCVRLLAMVGAVTAGLLCGCKVVNESEAEARRREELRERHPALYENERGEAMREREIEQAQQESLKRRQP